MASATTTCLACGKGGGKLQRCGRCRDVWFCNRECQVVARKELGHIGVNCRAPANEAHAPRTADAEVAPRGPDAAGPSTTTLGVDSASPATANACYACGTSDAKLLLCSRCRNAWFCSRECQDVARRELGHRGANCRPVDGAQRPASAENARSLVAAPSTAIDHVYLCQRMTDLSTEASQALVANHLNMCQRMADLSTEASQALFANTRIDLLAAVEKATEAATVADLIGGAVGKASRAAADLLLSTCLSRSGNKAAAARAAVSALRAARDSGSRSSLVNALSKCCLRAQEAPDEMAKAERESREQERLSGSPPLYDGLDLSQEGRISLPTTPAALSRLGLAYIEAAVAICDAALAAAGGRGSPAADDTWHVPSLGLEAKTRASLGASLHCLGERQRSLELIRQAVAMMRQVVRTAAPGFEALAAKQMLVQWLSNLGSVLNAPRSDRKAEAAACVREALELSEETDAVELEQGALIQLSNMSGRLDQPVGPTEAAALRSRLNALYAQAGRTPVTSCTICLEPLEQPDGGAEQDATGVRDRGTAEGGTDSSVRVLLCGHQFHRGCLCAWWRTAEDWKKCPLCMKWPPPCARGSCRGGATADASVIAACAGAPCTCIGMCTRPLWGSRSRPDRAT